MLSEWLVRGVRRVIALACALCMLSHARTRLRRPRTPRRLPLPPFPSPASCPTRSGGVLAAGETGVAEAAADAIRGLLLSARGRIRGHSVRDHPRRLPRRAWPPRGRGPGGRRLLPARGHIRGHAVRGQPRRLPRRAWLPRGRGWGGRRRSVLGRE